MPYPSREARTAGYRDGAGLFAAMLGDSTVRDFAIESPARMLQRQWLNNQANPFLNSDPRREIDSVFERLSRVGPVRAVEYARSGAGVGPARTWLRRRFQWIANVKTLDGQVDELLTAAVRPDLLLVWIGHNNLDFVTECKRFSPQGDLDEACEAIAGAFAAAFRSDLSRLVESAARGAGARPCAVVVYGLVNPVATRLARDEARARKKHNPNLYPYLEVAEGRFPPLRPEHADRLVALSRRLSRELEDAARVAQERATSSEGPRPGMTAPRVSVAYSDTTATMDFSSPELLSDLDAWHASDRGKARIAEALFAGLHPALSFLGLRGPRVTACSDREPTTARPDV